MQNSTKYLFLIMIWSLVLSGCLSDKGPDHPISEDAAFTQSDRVARPAINTVFVSEGEKDAFNTTVTRNLQSTYAGPFEQRLNALNPDYTENLLGLNAQQFAGVLSGDVLTVATSGKTTFYDGTTVLTGRALSDDVIDVELTLIFGGPDGSEKPGLTSDNVDSNDKEFRNTFPYLAPAHQ